MLGSSGKWVSLFVRLWVEIARFIPVSGYTCSQPLREAVSWNTVNYVGERVKGKSASSWGCELKYKNIVLPMLTWIVSLFVRLWVEITVEKFSMSDIRCQPLREAVSWNKIKRSNKNEMYVSLFVRLWVEMGFEEIIITDFATSASSWGCELKYS